MDPFFSVIIPLYNKEKYIRNTLNKVLNQTFTDYEIIIVNDGSTDKSMALISNFTDPRIKIIHQKNLGVSTARNTGIEMALSKYICFLDADDTWKNDHLQTLHNTINQYPDAEMYCSRYVTQINDTTFTKNNLLDIKDDYEGYVKDFFKSSLVNRVALTSAVCIHKNIYKEIGGFEKNISSGQDLDYWIRIALKYRVAITNHTTLIYNFLNTNNSLSKININNKTLPNLDQYLDIEAHNENLKKFLDIYRIEYALQFYIIGLRKEKESLLKKVDKKNISFKTKILFNTPPFILRILLKLKHYLKNYGIDFNVYH